MVSSDNGTNLVAPDQELRHEINQVDIIRLGRDRHIACLLHSPSFLHGRSMGVPNLHGEQSACWPNKGATRHESLHTLMIVNNRPITSQSDDPRDLEPLTHSHLLILQPTKVPNRVFNKMGWFSRHCKRQVQYLADLIWTRWMHEYLPILRARTK